MNSGFLIFLSLAVVAAIMIGGLVNLFREGPEARSLSNKLMWARVSFQAIAILVLLGVLYVSGR